MHGCPSVHERVLAHAKSRVYVWSYVLLNITKIQQPSVMPLVSNLMLHACCPSIMDSYLQAGPSLNPLRSRWCAGLGRDHIPWILSLSQWIPFRSSSNRSNYLPCEQASERCQLNNLFTPQWGYVTCEWTSAVCLRNHSQLKPCTLLIFVI